MLSYDYDADKGWHDLKIVPYGPIEISPAAQGVWTISVRRFKSI